MLSLIARGLQRGEVGQVLSVSENTVAKYIKDIYTKEMLENLKLKKPKAGDDE